MSLINDALKKAARQRAEEQADFAPPAMKGGRRRIPRHGAPMTVQTLVLLAGGAVTLIVASVVITGILVTGKLEPKAPAAPKPLPVTQAPQSSPLVIVQVPRVTEAPARQPAPQPPTTVTVAQAQPSTRPNPPPPTAEPIAQAQPSVQPAASAPAANLASADATRHAAMPPPSRGDQVQSFVDNLHVTGVRAAGPDSKALVDGHIYRVNDVLDRNLGIRLQQVDPDHITLVDSQGATYIKSF